MIRFIVLILTAADVVNLVTAFNSTAYFDTRVVNIPHGNNSYSSAILAANAEEATRKVARIFGECETPPTVKASSLCQLHPNSDLCATLRNIDLPKANHEWFLTKSEPCNCHVGCEGSKKLRYPGCTCSEPKPCLFNEPCDWNLSPNISGDFKFDSIKVNHSNGVATTFARVSTKIHVNNSVATMESPTFAQSGHKCQLRFRYHGYPQSPLSNFKVLAVFSDSTKLLWSTNSASYRWENAEVGIGSYVKPFKVLIQVESGPVPTEEQRHRQEDSDKLSFSITNVKFHECEENGKELNECNAGAKRMCVTKDNVQCLENVACDMKIDCPDGSDEMGCATKIIGAKCNFNNATQFCSGWTQYTKKINDVRTRHHDVDIGYISESTGQDENAGGLLQIVEPSAETQPTIPARNTSGAFLSYVSSDISEKKLSPRMSALVSPVFPPTNPLAYDPKSSLYKSCTLRYYSCSRTYMTKWQLAVLGKFGNVFESKKQVLKNFRADYHQTSECTWQRVSIMFPRQNFAFRLALFVEYSMEKDSVLAIDDLSFSPTCFDDSKLTDVANPITINTCNSTGADKPNDCRKIREVDGQTGHFVHDDGSQEWTVTNNGFYKIKVCGASGGSSENRKGKGGSCITSIAYLDDGQNIEFVVGQRGESPCLKKDVSLMQYEDSCTDNDYYDHTTKRRPGGAGGGGATLVSFDNGSSWPMIAAGGGGAGFDLYTNDYEIDMKLSGYGYSVNGSVTGKCDDECLEATPKSLFKPFARCRLIDVTVRGGFGGGGSSCDTNGGGGAGRIGGSSGEYSDGETGTSHVDDRFSKEFAMLEINEEADGFVTIVPCQKRCRSPTICTFRNVSSSEEVCTCPDGKVQEEGKLCGCPLKCPEDSKCTYRSFTMEPVCQCADGGLIEGDMKSCRIDIPLPLTIRVLIGFFFILIIIMCITGKTLFSCKKKNDSLSRELEEFKLLRQGEFLYDELYFGRQRRSSAIEKLPPIDRNNLNLEGSNPLGKGNFGEVVQCTYKNGKEQRLVAVKTISRIFRNNPNAQQDFCNEALCLGTFVNDNIVELLGVSFDTIPYLIVMELMNGGDMLTFLKDARPNYQYLNPLQLTMKDLLKLAHDVSKGCRCLEMYNYVHRDIAARNILLTIRGSERVAKIADFGMAKEITIGTDYYRINGRTLFPIKWTPPEAFIDGVSTTKSDVWSFGIMCWEIFSLGVIPYPNRTNEDVMLLLAQGHRLEYPYGVPLKVYEMMRLCWKTESEERPNFETLSRFLEDMMEDDQITSMPFPIHPAVRNSYMQHTSPCETPLTATTDISDTFPSTSLEESDNLILAEIKDKLEKPYKSDNLAVLVETLSRTARGHAETEALLPTPESEIQNRSNDEDDERPEKHDYERLQNTREKWNMRNMAVQNTGPQIIRPEMLNIGTSIAT